MRFVILLVVTAGAARADSTLWEFGANTPLADASQLVEASCDLDVDLRGAVAVVEQRQRLANRGAVALGAVEQIELPAGARVIGVSAAGRAAIAVAAGFTSEASDPAVIGADPVVVQALPVQDDRHARARAIVEPIAPGGELELVVRWTALATIDGGMLHLELPGRTADGGLGGCRGKVHATPGPGATVARIAVDGVRTSSFKYGVEDVAISVELAFARPEPVVWTQRESLGNGVDAEVVTVATPVGPAPKPRRVLFVIDGSRSMALVGARNVTRVVRAVAGALPDAEIAAIIYDRTAAAVPGGWQPADKVAQIEDAIASHAAANGSDLGAALALAHVSLSDGPPALIVAIGDGEIASETDLAAALDLPTRVVDVHAIELEPGKMHAPGEALAELIEKVGGSYVAVPAGDLDHALAGLDSWLRPAWVGLSLGSWPIGELRSGAGLTRLSIRKHGERIVLAAHGARAIEIAEHVAPAAPIAQLLLADSDDSRRAQHPALDAGHSFVVLTATGKVAADRRAMVAAGGPYVRTIAAPDPVLPSFARRAGATATAVSALDHDALERLFQLELQPKAYACYERALLRDRELAGTATFHIAIARGEVARATVTGIVDPAFTACLVDAAYGMTPPFPNPDLNADEHALANYPLSFEVRASHPFVVAGDADSSSPIDIDGIKVDTHMPLGNLRPPQGP